MEIGMTGLDSVHYKFLQSDVLVELSFKDPYPRHFEFYHTMHLFTQKKGDSPLCGSATPRAQTVSPAYHLTGRSPGNEMQGMDM